MFLHKAMRYYRLWIYSANAVILLGAIIFSLSVLYVGSDYRLRLIVRSVSASSRPHQQQHQAPIPPLQDANSDAWGSHSANSAPEQHQQTPKSSSNTAAPTSTVPVSSSSSQQLPTNYKQHQDDEKEAEEEEDRGSHSYFSQDISVGPLEPNLLLAYVVVAIQAGLLQALGCFGAMRMRERLIQAFWLLILALTVFDIVFFLYWINRFELINEGLQRHLAWRLREQYGWWPEVEAGSTMKQHLQLEGSQQMNQSALFVAERGSMLEQSDKKRLDKIFTEIVDKIQADSQCCGILRPSDYRHSAWRRLKADQLVQLAHERHLNRLRNNTTTNGAGGPAEAGGAPSGSSNSLELLSGLVQELKWVPASCCRRTPLNQTLSTRNGLLDRFLDDSQVRHPNLVPAWSPSMALPGAKEQHESRTQAPPTTFGPPPELMQDRFMGNPSRRRLLAKQGIYGSHTQNLAGSPLGPKNQRLEDEQHTLERRWAVESRVNEQGQVLMRLVVRGSPDGESASTSGLWSSDTPRGRPIADPETQGWWVTLSNLRHLLLRNESQPSSSENFLWPNSFGLSLHQFKLVEGYLSGRSRRHLRPEGPLVEEEEEGQQAGESKQRRRQQAAQLSLLESLETDLVAIIRSELTCVPRQYTDSSAIYTDGCQPHIRAWLEASGHLLFVAGFCVLTVLKLCSLVLLRLEIREMIHKIRVLKGMATEYNALADLEAYLPAASVCAPELATGSPLLPPAAAATSSSPLPGALQPVPPPCSPVFCAAPMSPLGPATGPTPVPARSASPSPTRRLGGSFSEAVVAAASRQLAASQLQQQQQQQKPLQQQHHQHHHHQLLSANRANSMKAVMGPAGMLDPANALSCARSTSAHLHHLSALAAGPTKTTTGGYLNAQSSLSAADHLFASGMIPLSRRHTAVSVCPAAAAAVAAAAAHHLMSRRGTCYTNQAFPLTASPAGSSLTSGGAQQPPHHRNPAPAQQLPADHTNNTQQKQTAALWPQPDAHGASPAAGSGQQQQQQQRTAPRLRELAKPASSCGADGSQQRQLLSLLYPFKRQSSGGAQSACNFSLDSTAADQQPQQQESRRSIH